MSARTAGALTFISWTCTSGVRSQQLKTTVKEIRDRQTEKYLRYPKNANCIKKEQDRDVRDIRKELESRSMSVMHSCGKLRRSKLFNSVAKPQQPAFVKCLNKGLHKFSLAFVLSVLFRPSDLCMYNRVYGKHAAAQRER